MAEIRTATTLRAKADEISASIVRYEKLLNQARRDLMHVNATLAIFEGKGGDQIEHRAYIDLKRVFRHGEIAGHVLAILKDGESDTVEIARRIGVLKGLDTCDAVMMRSIGGSVMHSLRGLEQRR